MCGIVALVGSRPAAPQLLEGLRQLEYRGYDSAGLAVVDADQQLNCLRAKGKLVHLSALLERDGAPGQCGIGHTRWATHGKPEEHNVHLHRLLTLIQMQLLSYYIAARRGLDLDRLHNLAKSITVQ